MQWQISISCATAEAGWLCCCRVYRDKRGRRLKELETFMKVGEGEVAAEDEEENMEWGKGLVQKKAAL